ncbi:MAG: MBL fold metallo-hydrolase [Dorea sp.]|nr:MBL fold metallo-hydrolase [Dorea sp.]
MNCRKRYVLLMMMAILFLCNSRQVEAAGGETRIHFISLDSATDAILLESNGHYGMVDSGEDWDYPDGTDYPLRYGVTTNCGYEQQVIHYLEQLGVKKLDFYIATHAHSDHIGSGDEILRHFPTDRLYIGRYDDSYMLDAHGRDKNDPYYVSDAKEYRLWDNQYVYDRLIQAAKETGTEIITDLDLEEHADERSFTMGDMSIDIMNYERLRDEEGNIVPVSSENLNSLVVKVEAYGRVALLTSDLEPTDGDSIKIALQLIDELEDTNSNQDPVPDIEENGTEEQPDDDIKDNPDDRSDQAEEMMEGYKEELLEDIFALQGINDMINEAWPNTGTTITLDLMKMCHHAIDYNNTTYFLTSLNPETVVVTNGIDSISIRERSCLPDAQMYATNSDSASVIATFTAEGIQTEYTELTPGWQRIDGTWYYFDKNGRTLPQGAHEADGRWFYFDRYGGLSQTGWIQENDNWYYAEPYTRRLCIGWKTLNGKRYYFDESGVMQKNTMMEGVYLGEDGAVIPGYIPSGWVRNEGHWSYYTADGTLSVSCWKYLSQHWYYFDENGWMVTGWQKIGGKWYYMYDSGIMASSTWIGNSYVDASGGWIPNAAKNEWLSSGGRWWYRHGDGSYTRSGWESIDGKYYYFDSEGWMVTGWQKSNGFWYYLLESGEMYCSGWKVIRQKWYYFEESGKMMTGWFPWNGQTYYLKQDGAMAKDWNYIDGNYYYFYSDGVMASDVWINGFYLDVSGAWNPDKTQ